MATRTITISAVESRFENYYREDPGDGSTVLYATYLLCPTAITAPYLVTGFTYNIGLSCTDSADSSISYTYTGTYPGSSILEFTTHTPGAAEGTWKDAITFPSAPPNGGTCYLAINEDNLGLGQDFVLYQLSGTITFTYSVVENYNIVNNVSNVQYNATLQEIETNTTPSTNKLSFGSAAPKSLYYGSSPVQKVYLGNTLLYSVSSSSSTEIYGISIASVGTPVYLADSRYTSVSINGVTLEVDTEKKVGSTQLTVSVVSGSVIAPPAIDIYAWIPSDQPDAVYTVARLDGYLRSTSSTTVKATWSWSDIIVAVW